MNNVRKYNLNDLLRMVNMHLDLFDKLQLIETLTKELDYTTIVNYVKRTGEKDKNIRNRLKAGKIPCKEIDNTIFIIGKMQ